ncbi:ABC transporter ATP-binding protein [Fibrobacterota bacterium]
MPEPVLKVKNLSLGLRSGGRVVSLTEEVNFEVGKGEMFGLVGESGCGKTITALAALRFLPDPGGVLLNGEVLLGGRNVFALDDKSLKDLRGSLVSMIFQEPVSAMDPLYTVQTQLLECFKYHAFPGNKRERIEEIMERVGLTDYQRILAAYPHELSGGMLQRVMIAMALLLKPALIIADEPTTALDVTIQAQIMDLLVSLKRELGASILLITHNLGLIAQYTDRVAVMYAGRIVEESPIGSFLQSPQHPYTKGLLKALPDLNREQSELIPIPGQVPQPADFETGCRFRKRCPDAMDVCVSRPSLLENSAEHKVACFLYENPSGAN